MMANINDQLNEIGVEVISGQRRLEAGFLVGNSVVVHDGNGMTFRINKRGTSFSVEPFAGVAQPGILIRIHEAD